MRWMMAGRAMKVDMLFNTCMVSSFNAVREIDDDDNDHTHTHTHTHTHSNTHTHTHTGISQCHEIGDLSSSQTNGLNAGDLLFKRNHVCVRMTRVCVCV